MPLNVSGEYDDVINDSYVVGVVAVGTTQIEAKASTNRLEGRENLRIYNNSSKTIYFGPSGVTISTGEPILKKQWVSISVGDNIAVYLITDSGTATDIRIQEMA